MYTLIIIYLTGAVIFSTMCAYVMDENGNTEKPLIRDRLVAGASWPYFFYQIIKEQV